MPIRNKQVRFGLASKPIDPPSAHVLVITDSAMILLSGEFMRFKFFLPRGPGPSVSVSPYSIVRVGGVGGLGKR
jgi:hypothetical protein